MREMLIEKNVVINNVDCARKELEVLSGERIHDLEIVKKFVTTEKYTKFFVDRKLKTSVNNDSDHSYLWLDTGFTDRNNQPIFISLVRMGHEYVGYKVGTAKTLADGIKREHQKYRKDIAANYSRFLNKYAQKCEERKQKHIDNVNQYYLSKANEASPEENEMAKKLRLLNQVWEADPEEVLEEAENKPAEEETFTEEEQEITMGLLFDMLKEREQYIQELLTALEKNKAQSDAEIKGLVEVIKEQSVVIQERTEALTRIRTFNDEESLVQFQREQEKEERQKAKTGHNLLGSRKKIMLLGSTNLSVEVMKGIITKEFGFEEDDFEYETDYHKVVHNSGRIMNSNRYEAIIFGCCPHSASGAAGWSSVIEKCKRTSGETVVVDARNTSGNLRVTKASFRKALEDICMQMSEAA